MADFFHCAFLSICHAAFNQSCLLGNWKNLNLAHKHFSPDLVDSYSKSEVNIVIMVEKYQSEEQAEWPIDS